MTERLCTWDEKNPDECGKPTEEYVRLYHVWGKGAIGTIVLGNLPCDRRTYVLILCALSADRNIKASLRR